MSRVLVVNSGSSSLKYQLIELDGERMLASGLVERIGEAPPLPEEIAAGDRLEGGSAVTSDPLRDGRWRSLLRARLRDTLSAPQGAVFVPDHTVAFRVMLEGLRAQGVDLDVPLAAIGHRVVHGGERFREPTVVTEEVKREIEELSALAPLHNPPNLAGIEAAERTFPGIPQVAVFDTAFHQSLSPAAFTYAIDAELAKANHVRRYGFHGTSFEYVAGETARFLGRPLEELRIIVLHIGNGASACAVSGGRSVETSMGLTPLEGLMMGTRGGDIDPGVLIHLQRAGGLSADALDDLLNHGSGLLGLGGHGDIRDVQKAAEEGDERAGLAFEVYLHRIRHYVGAYLAQLGGADAIVFTAGVGENNAAVRSGALAGLNGLGILVDAKRNALASREARRISPDASPVAVLVIPTNEELEIARQTVAAIGAGPSGGEPQRVVSGAK